MGKETAVGPRVVEPSEGLGPGTPRVGNEGSAARWTNERAYELAKKGDREAIMTLTRRGIELPPNVRYVTGDPTFGRVTYNPRDVTRFEPQPANIRQGGKRLTRIAERKP